MAQPGVVSITEIPPLPAIEGKERRGRQFVIVSDYVAHGDLELTILILPP